MAFGKFKVAFDHLSGALMMVEVNGGGETLIGNALVRHLYRRLVGGMLVDDVLMQGLLMEGV